MATQQEVSTDKVREGLAAEMLGVSEGAGVIERRPG